MLVCVRHLAEIIPTRSLEVENRSFHTLLCLLSRVCAYMAIPYIGMMSGQGPGGILSLAQPPELKLVHVSTWYQRGGYNDVGEVHRANSFKNTRYKYQNYKLEKSEGPRRVILCLIYKVCHLLHLQFFLGAYTILATDILYPYVWAQGKPYDFLVQPSSAHRHFSRPRITCATSHRLVTSLFLSLTFIFTQNLSTVW